MKKLSLLVVLIAVALGSQTIASSYNPAYSESAIIDTVPFYANGNYNPAVARPNDYIDGPIGVWPARYYQIGRFLTAVDRTSDRVIVQTHGATYEGRTLYHVVISSPENLRNLDQILANNDKLADPRLTSATEADQIIETMPAVAWLGYSIHGDEISGTDAATQLIYHLAAARDSATIHLLNNLVIVIDPSENPDGRERYLSMLQTYRSHTPNYDPAAMQHSGVWPWGRGNHYLFDLNRDWILMTQPETIGRVETELKYHPHMVVDGHEMGANGTFLFSPPRQLINYNTPSNVYKWWEIFADDQARALDQRGWPYYTGEWNDQWYPGYGSAFGTFSGSIGILYEQAGVDGGLIKQHDDYFLTYHEAVNHQFTSSLANLTTTADNRAAILRDYYDARAGIISEGKKTDLTFIYAPEKDKLKLKLFIDRLIDQGIEVEQAKSGFTVASARNFYHEELSNKEFPAGTYLVRTSQPMGALAKAILEFDPHMKTGFLEEERRYLEKFNESRMYETSAWSISLAYDADAYTTNSIIRAETELVKGVPAPTGKLVDPDARYGFVIDFEGELTYLILTRLFDKDLTIYAATKPFTLEGHSYDRGALVLRRRGNPQSLQKTLAELAEQIGINVYGVNTGLSTEGSRLGAGTFQLLKQPRVALVTGYPMDFTDYASLWHTIDIELGIPHSLISINSVSYGDLSRFNVLIVPSSWGGGFGRQLGHGGVENLRNWIKDGGVLIAESSTARWVADSSTGLSAVSLRSQMLDKLAKFDLAVEREKDAEAPVVDTMALYHPDKVIAKEEPKDDKKESKLPLKEAEELERYDRRFAPGGVIMAADIDTEDWLSFGMEKRAPVFFWARDYLLTDRSVHTTARLADQNHVRLSGLLWPEAREKVANSAYATHERSGRGQIILFAGPSNFRDYFYSTRRMLANAILYGPGMGSGGDDY